MAEVDLSSSYVDDEYDDIEFEIVDDNEEVPDNNSKDEPIEDDELGLSVYFGMDQLELPDPEDNTAGLFSW